MFLTVEAVYQNGMLRPVRPLDLKENERVRVTIYTPADFAGGLAAVERSHGLVPWTGDAETLRRLAEDDEFGILEVP